MHPGLRPGRRAGHTGHPRDTPGVDHWRWRTDSEDKEPDIPPASGCRSCPGLGNPHPGCIARDTGPASRAAGWWRSTLRRDRGFRRPIGHRTPHRAGTTRAAGTRSVRAACRPAGGGRRRDAGTETRTRAGNRHRFRKVERSTPTSRPPRSGSAAACRPRGPDRSPHRAGTVRKPTGNGHRRHALGRTGSPKPVRGRNRCPGYRGDRPRGPRDRTNVRAHTARSPGCTPVRARSRSGRTGSPVPNLRPVPARHRGPGRPARSRCSPRPGRPRRRRRPWPAPPPPRQCVSFAAPLRGPSPGGTRGNGFAVRPTAVGLLRAGPG